MGEERRIACVFLPPLLYSLCKVASKLQTKNQQSEVHLETADNYSNTGSSTAYVYSSPWEMCVSHWTEPPGDPSIKRYLTNFASKGGKSMDNTDNSLKGTNFLMQFLWQGILCHVRLSMGGAHV